MIISDSKNKILKEGTNGTVSEDYFEDKLGTMTRKDVIENILIDNRRNIPLGVLGQRDRNCYNKHIPHRRYTKAKSIETLAINKYRQNGRGICFKDLLSNDLAKHKLQAQATLKHCLRANILFTANNHKPQQYILPASSPKSQTRLYQ